MFEHRFIQGPKEVEYVPYMYYREGEEAGEFISKDLRTYEISPNLTISDRNMDEFGIFKGNQTLIPYIDFQENFLRGGEDFYGFRINPMHPYGEKIIFKTE